MCGCTGTCARARACVLARVYARARARVAGEGGAIEGHDQSGAAESEGQTGEGGGKASRRAGADW